MANLEQLVKDFKTVGKAAEGFRENPYDSNVRGAVQTYLTDNLPEEFAAEGVPELNLGTADPNIVNSAIQESLVNSQKNVVTYVDEHTEEVLNIVKEKEIIFNLIAELLKPTVTATNYALIDETHKKYQRTIEIAKSDNSEAMLSEVGKVLTNDSGELHPYGATYFMAIQLDPHFAGRIFTGILTKRKEKFKEALSGKEIEYAEKLLDNADDNEKNRFYLNAAEQAVA